MSIRLMYALASSLYMKVSYDENRKIECYLEADKLLSQLKDKIDETEIITADLYNEEITLYKVNLLQCKVLYEIANLCFTNHEYEHAYDFFSRAITSSLDSYGTVENALETDQLLLYIAKKSCEIAIYCEKILHKQSNSFICETRKILNTM